MAETSKISWTDATWNSIIGCSHVSPGCQNCYAETLALRFGWSKKPWGAQNAAENVQLRPKRLGEPLKWAEPKKIFVNSLSDVFHEMVPDDYIDKIFAVMAATPWHTYQILTKRPERMLAYLTTPDRDEAVGYAALEVYETYPRAKVNWHNAMNLVHRQGYVHTGAIAEALGPGDQARWPLPNVWLGVSVEDQRRADERIPLLLQTPAAVRFLSCEPLLGPVYLGKQFTWVNLNRPIRGDWPIGHDLSSGPGIHPALVNRHGAVSVDLGLMLGNLGVKPHEMDWCRKLDWVIIGGESGHGYRPMDLDWAREIRDQCQAAGVALWFKQTGGPRPGTGEELDGQVWHEFPQQSKTGQTTEVNGAND